MIPRILTILVLAGALVAPGAARDGAPAPANANHTHEATTPTHRLQAGWWKQRHEQKLKAAMNAQCDLLFVGDSITQMWESHGPKVWDQYYADRNAFNIGYSGDQTQHVLWRLDQGEMADFKPKVAVLMIGTNNTAHQANWTARKVADGVQAIIDRIHAMSPETRILLLAVFPRGATADHPLRRRNDQINALLSEFDRQEKVRFLDIGPKFLDATGNLSREVMPDLLHPHAAGYQIWAEAMEPTLQQMMK